MRHRFSAVSLTLMVATLVTACGARKDADSAATDSAGAESAASASAAAATPASTASSMASSASRSDAPLTVADIDRWQHGLDAELKAVRDAGTRMKSAKTADDSMNALTAAGETATRPIAASAAGVDEQRYQYISTRLSPIAGEMAPLEQEMNVSGMPAPAVAALKQSRAQALTRAIEGMPADMVDSLRSRAAVLRKQDLALAGERLKVATGR